VALQNIGLLSATQQVTLCLWVNGQYEDTVYSGTEAIKSTIVPALALRPAEIFALGTRPHQFDKLRNEEVSYTTGDSVQPASDFS
jgi:hypothetical protein